MERKEANPGFHESPTMQVHFGNGKVIAMSRRERRRQHLYGDRLTVVKGQPTPPPVFHSDEGLGKRLIDRLLTL